MNRTLFFACAALAGAPLLGCSGEPAGMSASFPADPLLTLASDGGALKIEVRSAPEQPPPRGVISLEYRITHQDGTPADGLTLAIVPWMPDHGHGASVVPSVTPMGSGRYVVSDVALVMPGTWELRTTFAGPTQDRATPSLQIP